VDSAGVLKSPMWLNRARAEEVLSGWPLDEIAQLKPLLVMRRCQLRWLVVVSNAPGLVDIGRGRRLGRTANMWSQRWF